MNLAPKTSCLELREVLGLVDSEGVADPHPDRRGDEMEPRQRCREAQLPPTAEQRLIRHDDAHRREEVERHQPGRLQVLVLADLLGFDLFRYARAHDGGDGGNENTVQSIMKQQMTERGAPRSPTRG